MKFVGDTSGQKEYSEMDIKKMQDEARKLYASLAPDILPLYASTIGDVKSYAAVSNMDRQTIAGVQAIAMNLDVREKDFADALVRFFQGLPAVMSKHEADLRTYCENVSMTEREKTACGESTKEMIKGMEESMKDEASMKELKDVLSKADVKTLSVYVNPIDNTLMKVNGSLGIDAKALADLNSSSDDMDVENFEVKFNMEEVKRGHNPTISAPTDARDVVQTIKDIMSKMGVPSMGGAPVNSQVPVNPSGVPSKMTPAQRKAYEQQMIELRKQQIQNKKKY
jgi:hypothetical protein